MALVIDRTMMDMMGIQADTPLEITVRNGSLVVTPVHTDIPSEEIQAALTRLRPRYKKMLENLAK